MGMTNAQVALQAAANSREWAPASEPEFQIIERAIAFKIWLDDVDKEDREAAIQRHPAKGARRVAEGATGGAVVNIGGHPFGFSPLSGISPVRPIADRRLA